MPAFTYCLNTSTIRPTPLLKKIEVASRAGYSAIEPWNVEIDEYLAQGGSIPELRRALDGAGLKVVSMIALGDWITTEGEAHTRALDECKRRMAQAAELGSPSIVASPPHEVVDLAHAGKRFTELFAIGESMGVAPSMEFLGFVAGVHTLDQAWTIASATGHPRATIVADVFHLIRGGGKVDDLLRIQGSQLSIFHINDLPPVPDPLAQRDEDRVMVGEGIAPLPRVIANLRTIGYSGPISLELFNRDLWALDPLNVVQEGIDAIRDLVEA